MTQPDAHVLVAEGARLELRCNDYSPSVPYLYWHVQYPNQGPQLPLQYILKDTLVKGIKGFEDEFKKCETSLPLEETLSP